MMSAIGLYFILLDSTGSIQWSVYLSVILSAIAITFFEWWYPYRRNWHPGPNDIGHDVTFMLLVQVLLPQLLSFLAALAILTTFHQHDLQFNHWWPRHWAPAAQVVLMLLVADFFRYWLHRAAHEWIIPLWRLHAVHHSPQKLYWLNVGRFHPLEKSIQFLFDALPFILLGVSETVLSLYFVLYSVNGFFQHCNIDLRLGFMNYLISGPELHRWHHSRIITESNANYGNNLIIWDVVFGTRYLPDDKEVGELGLLNRNYPDGFLAQMKTPFIKNLDKG